MKTILYVYGYGSSPNSSSTMKVIKKVVGKLGFKLVSIEYDQKNPENGIEEIEKYIKDNDIKYVIGHSLGGFITMCICSDVKKIVINPCMEPHFELPKLGDFSDKSIKQYKNLERWLRSGDETPWLSQIEDVMGLFGDHDELFSYYSSFKLRYPRTYLIKSGHRPTIESFTDNITKKIEEFFS